MFLLNYTINLFKEYKLNGEIVNKMIKSWKVGHGDDFGKQKWIVWLLWKVILVFCCGFLKFNSLKRIYVTISKFYRSCCKTEFDSLGINSNTYTVKHLQIDILCFILPRILKAFYVFKNTKKLFPWYKDIIIAVYLYFWLKWVPK